MKEEKDITQTKGEVKEKDSTQSTARSNFILTDCLIVSGPFVKDQTHTSDLGGLSS